MSAGFQKGARVVVHPGESWGEDAARKLKGKGGVITLIITTFVPYVVKAVVELDEAVGLASNGGQTCRAYWFTEAELEVQP